MGTSSEQPRSLKRAPWSEHDLRRRLREWGIALILLSPFLYFLGEVLVGGMWSAWIHFPQIGLLLLVVSFFRGSRASAPSAPKQRAIDLLELAYRVVLALTIADVVCVVAFFSGNQWWFLPISALVQRVFNQPPVRDLFSPDAICWMCFRLMPVLYVLLFVLWLVRLAKHVERKESI